MTGCGCSCRPRRGGGGGGQKRIHPSDSKGVQGAFKVVVLGLDGAGKSTVLAALQRQPLTGIPPTFGCNTSDPIRLDRRELMVYDLGGDAGIRAIWPEYYAEVHAFVFVLDLADRSRFAEAKDELAKARAHAYLAGKPFVVLSNKAEVEGAVGTTDEDVVAALGLEPDGQEGRAFRVQRCSATLSRRRKINKGVKLGMRWLVGMMMATSGGLAVKMAADVAEEKERIAAERAAKKARVAAIREAREQAAEDQAAIAATAPPAADYAAADDADGAAATPPMTHPQRGEEARASAEQLAAALPVDVGAMPAVDSYWSNVGDASELSPAVDAPEPTATATAAAAAAAATAAAAAADRQQPALADSGPIETGGSWATGRTGVEPSSKRALPPLDRGAEARPATVTTASQKLSPLNPKKGGSQGKKKQKSKRAKKNQVVPLGEGGVPADSVEDVAQAVAATKTPISPEALQGFVKHALSVERSMQSAETRWLQTSEVNLRGLVDGAKQAWKKMEQACNRQTKSINISKVGAKVFKSWAKTVCEAWDFELYGRQGAVPGVPPGLRRDAFATAEQFAQYTLRSEVAGQEWSELDLDHTKIFMVLSEVTLQNLQAANPAVAAMPVKRYDDECYQQVLRF